MRCEANEFVRSAHHDFAFLHEDTAGVLRYATTREVVGGSGHGGLKVHGGYARGEVGGDGQNGEGRPFVGTAVPEGKLVVAVVHFVGGDAVFVHVGEGGTAFAEIIGVGETPNSRIASGDRTYGLQGGKGATAFVVAHVGGRGEDVACAGCEVVDAKALGVVAHEAPELFAVFGIHFGVGEFERLLRVVGFEHVAFLADLHGVPLRTVGELAVDEGGGGETRIPLGGGFGLVGAGLDEEAFEVDIAVHPLGGEGEGVVGVEDAARNANGLPLHVVFREAVGGEVVAVLDDDTGVFKAVGGVHLDGEGLAEGGFEAFELLTVGGDDFAVEVVLRDNGVLTMYVETDVDEGTTVLEHVGGSEGIVVVPVDLVAQAVDAGGEVGGNGEGARRDGVAVAHGLAFAVFAFIVGIADQFGVGIEFAVLVLVEVDVAVHPRAVVGDGGGDDVAGLGKELGVAGVSVDGARRGDVEDLLFAVDAESDDVEVTVGARVGLLLVDGDGVVAGDERRCGAVVHADIVDVGGEVFGEIVRAFAVGHDDEAVDLHPFVAGSGEYDFLPFVGFESRAGDLGKLHHFVTLTGTVLALAESDDHGTSGLGRANPSVYVFGLGGEIEGFVERDACAEGVRTVA